MIEEILARKERPTAIVFYNDHRALGGIKALLEKGYKLPEDFSVVGFDNVPEGSLFYPSLTTVGFNVAYAAEKAAELVVAGDSGEHILLEPKLIARQSTGRV